MARGWQGHPVFAKEPFSQRDAWVWLIEEAYYKPRKCRVGSQLCDVERGQFIHALRFMAEAWGWKKDKVARFLRVLQDAHMIRVESATGAATAESRVTICNYDKYQIENDNDATDDETTTRQPRDNDATEKKEGKERKENIGGGGSAPTHEKFTTGGTVPQDTDPEASRLQSATEPERIIARRFLELRTELWPNWPNFPAPTSTIEGQAKSFLDQGGTVPLITEVMERGMRTAARQGKTATGSLKAFHLSISNAIAERNAGIANEGGHYAAGNRGQSQQFRNGFVEIISSGELG